MQFPTDNFCEWIAEDAPLFHPKMLDKTWCMETTFLHNAQTRASI